MGLPDATLDLHRMKEGAFLGTACTRNLAAGNDMVARSF